MSEFYVRRDGKVSGPLSLEQVKKLQGSGKLKNSDTLSTSASGPFGDLATVLPDDEFGQQLEDADVVSFLDEENRIAGDFTPAKIAEVESPNLEDIDFSSPAKASPIVNTVAATTPVINSAPQPAINQANNPQKAKPSSTYFKSHTSKEEPESAVSFGLAFLLSPSEFLTSPIYRYQNPDAPALAAAIRFYAFLAKVVFYIVWVLLFLCNFGLISRTCLGLMEASEPPTPAEWVGILVLGLPLILVFDLIVLVFNNLFLVLNVGGCELARVLAKIEVNTRNG